MRTRRGLAILAPQANAMFKATGLKPDMPGYPSPFRPHRSALSRFCQGVLGVRLDALADAPPAVKGVRGFHPSEACAACHTFRSLSSPLAQPGGRDQRGR